MLCCVSLLKVGFQTADPADNLGNRISKGNFLIFLGLDALYCEHLVTDSSWDSNSIFGERRC